MFKAALRRGLFCFGVVFFLQTSAQGFQPAVMEIVTSPIPEPGAELAPFDIRFIVHANGHKIQGMVFPFELNFSNGNIMGPLSDGFGPGPTNVIPSSKSIGAFASRAWNPNYGQGTDPDTMLYVLSSFGDPWEGSGEVFRIHVVPSDTGAIAFTQIISLPPASILSMQAPDGSDIPHEFWNQTVQVPPVPGNVRFRISSISGTDELFWGSPSRLFFHVDANGHEIAGMEFILRWAFSNGNLVGPISDVTGEVEYSNPAVNAFESIGWSPAYGNGTDQDTSWLVLTSVDAELYSDDDWIWSVSFTPQDTGTIRIDDSLPGLPPAYWPGLTPVGWDGSVLPNDFVPAHFTVVPCPWERMGDNNADGVINSADLIYFINYIFKSGPDPLPERSVGDVNCSGGLGGSDIIWMVNYLFKGGPEPCECTMRRI